MGGLHNMQLPAGPQAAALFDLWTWMLVICTLVFVLTMAVLAMAVKRAPRVSESAAPDTDAHPRVDARLRRGVRIGVAASAVLLVVLLLESFLTDRAIARLPLTDAIHIDLIGHQFWWEARYDATDPVKAFFTANELHVPVGRPVLLTLRSDDVIHSFWVPSLHGKKDLIPGRESTFAFRADRAGTYRGQCAEFCGYQHAHMTLFVIADEPADYERWVEAQRRDAASPSTDVQRRGHDLVVSSSCGMCHRIAGTEAQGRRAPDLSHLASRATLGAGTVRNDDPSLSAWIADAQKSKPGVNMPPHAYDPDDLTAIVAYLDSLR